MKESKKLMIGFGVVAVICLCTLGLTVFTFNQIGKKMENISATDPASIAQTMDSIAEFDVPEGYRPVGLSMLGYDMINFIPETSTSGMSIMLMQYNGFIAANTSPVQLQEQLKRSAEQQSGTQGVAMQVVESRQEIIRGETVTITISEGEFQGVTMRQWITVFQGNEGPTILMVQGTAEGWDDQLLEDFIRSIE
jgi:hypothetical protein